MKNGILTLALLSLSLGAFAKNPIVKPADLTGTIKGESANGPCLVKITRLGDIMVLDVDQNMSKHKSIPVSVNALIQKISGDKCGRVTMNNECGTYSLEDNIQNGGGYNNGVTFDAETIKGQRCLMITIEDASFGDWIGGGHCNINLNRSGKGCYKL